MRERIMKQIDGSKITLTLSLDEARMVRHALAKEEVEKGVPTYSTITNVCPICNVAFDKGDNFCPGCGQRVEFTETEDIPL